MSEDFKLADLLKPKNATKRKRSRSKPWYRRLKPIYILYFFIVMALGVAVWGITVADSLSKVSRSQGDLTILLESLENKNATDYTLDDYEALNATLNTLNNSLVSMESRTRPIHMFAGLNSDLEAYFQLLEASVHITEGTSYMLAGLKPTLFFIEQGEANESPDQPRGLTFTTERLVELTASGNNRFLLAKAELEAAKSILEGLDRANLSADVMLDVEELQDFIAEIETYNDMALEAPQLLATLLGIDRPQTYLILSQNNDELRPSGGYISTWGWMQVQNGRIEEYQYFPTTATAPNPPPSETATVYPIPSWWIQFDSPIYAAWDGSWYADFAETAEMAAWFYNEGGNPSAPVDGVIGIDMVALQYLIAALGEVRVPEYNVTVNARDFRAVVYEIRANREGHKQFLAALYNEVIDLWRKADTDTRAQINRAFLQAFDEKHLMLYFVDEQLQNASTSLDWSGIQKVEAFQDYLMIADANLGNKSSSSVQRQFTYDVTINANQTIESRLGVFYNFPASLAENDPAIQPEHYGNQKDYYTILQIFTPPSTQVLEDDPEDPLTPVVQNGFNIFTDVKIILYDNSHSFYLTYTNPEAVESVGGYYRYYLQIDKQPGSTDDVATVSISLPLGASTISISPEPDAIYDLGNTVLEFNFNLTQDQSIEVLYQSEQ